MKSAVATLILVFLSGCSTTFLQIPIQRFSSPEVSGTTPEGFVDEWAFGFRRDDTIEIREDSSNARTLRARYNQGYEGAGLVTKPHAGGDFPLSLGSGFAERFEYKLDLSMLFTPQILELKYQVLGETRKTSDAGNFSLAISGSVGAIPLNIHTNTESETNPIRWDLSETLLSIGVLGGYRISSAFLIYTGIFKNSASLSADRTEENAPGIGRITSHYEGHAVSTTLHLGLDCMPGKSKDGKGLFLLAEIASSSFTLDEIESVKNDLLAGLQLGARF